MRMGHSLLERMSMVKDEWSTRGMIAIVSIHQNSMRGSVFDIITVVKAGDVDSSKVVRMRSYRMTLIIYSCEDSRCIHQIT